MCRPIPITNCILIVLVCLFLPAGPVSAGQNDRFAALNGTETIRPPADDTDALSRLDRLAIRRTVGAQIIAIVSRDAELAFSFMTPEKQRKFQTASAYLNRLVRIFYPILYTERFQFTGLFTSQPVIQSVLLKGTKQRQWLAYFHMHRQADGEWRINDCVIKSKVETQN